MKNAISGLLLAVAKRLPRLTPLNAVRLLLLRAAGMRIGVDAVIWSPIRALSGPAETGDETAQRAVAV